MQSASVAPWQQHPFCFSHIPCLIPSHHHHHRTNRIIISSLKCQTKDYSHNTLSTEPTNNKIIDPYKKREFLEQLYFSFDDTNQEGIEQQQQKEEVTFFNMWWADLKAAVGQRINVEGIVGSVSVVARDRHLVMPHVSVTDIRHIDWVSLKKSGFRGVVFDKDNTITAPYSLRLWPPLESSIGQCKSVFGNNIAVFSNSAGLSEFDPDGRKAKALERAIGIKVVRHRVKKPAGTAEEIEKLLGCASSELIMVGDRPFTDIVFGNRNGFLTILTGPLNLSEEPFIVKQVRKLEVAVVNLWSNRGLKPMSHRLLRDNQFVKDPRSL